MPAQMSPPENTSKMTSDLNDDDFAKFTSLQYDVWDKTVSSPSPWFEMTTSPSTLAFFPLQLAPLGHFLHGFFEAPTCSE